MALLLTAAGRSILLRTMNKGLSHSRCNRDMSSALSSQLRSRMRRMRSDLFIASWDLRTPSASTGSPGCRIPAVSIKRTGTPPSTAISSTVSRVVPGTSVTIARSSESRAFSRVDFPTLGRPTMAMVNPSRRTFPCELAVSSLSTRTASWPISASRPCCSISSSG